DPGGLALGFTPSNLQSGTTSAQPAAVLGLLTSLLDAIREWCSSRADRVSECYLVFGPTDVFVFVIGQGQAYDFALSRELSDLTIELVEKGWPVQTMLLGASTPEELSAFVNPAAALLLFRA